MKRVLFLLICLGGVLCTMCDPEQYGGDYYVKNCTDQTLRLLQSGSGNSIYTPVGVVAPGDSVLFGSASVPIGKKKKIYFDLWLQGEVARQGEEVSLKLSSEDQILLKEWKYLDRNQPGKQFFNEYFWRHYDVFIEKSAFLTTTDIWVFDIVSEDITPVEP